MNRPKPKRRHLSASELQKIKPRLVGISAKQFQSHVQRIKRQGGGVWTEKAIGEGGKPLSICQNCGEVFHVKSPQDLQYFKSREKEVLGPNCGVCNPAVAKRELGRKKKG